ncbi:hemolysin [Endozoicomonas montiporae]|uniref:Hemolysin n=1 Tax=Endozoicomonas montiporae TaxID=1027273 RepID=A0A081N7V8_9GAMM|nr:hemolysin [Endozoicomonas montiporae]
MVALVAFVAIALVVSFFCSVFESVLHHLTPAYVINLEKKQSCWAGKVRWLHDNLDRSLAAVLTLNTIAHTFGAAGAGAQTATVFGDASVGLFAAILTVLILFVSEIIPKTLGTNGWHKLAPYTAVCVGFLVKLQMPLIWLAEQVTRQLTPKHKKNDYLREEISAMADIGEEEGALLGTGSDLLKNMLRFRDLKIIEIMTPRSVLFTLPESMDAETYLQTCPDNAFSRVPVYSDEPDDINGFVMKNDILMAYHQRGGSITLGELKRPIIAVLENESLPRLMSTLLEQRNHIAMVVTEYGDIRGIVTLEDMIETLLGREIVDESDEVVDMQQVARQKWAERLPSQLH